MSWGYREKKAWYVGPAHNHYCCVRCYVPGTNQEPVVDTLTPLPTYYINIELQYSVEKILNYYMQHHRIIIQLVT